MGDLAIEATQSKNMLGPGVKYDNKERQRSLDQRLQIFGLLMDELLSTTVKKFLTLFIWVMLLLNTRTRLTH